MLSHQHLSHHQIYITGSRLKMGLAPSELIRVTRLWHWFYTIFILVLSQVYGIFFLSHRFNFVLLGVLFVVFASRICLLESTARGIAQNACDHIRLMYVCVFVRTLYMFTSLTVDIENRNYGLFNQVSVLSQGLISQVSSELAMYLRLALNF